MSRPVLLRAAVALAVGVAILGLGSPAGAHGDDGDMEIITLAPVGSDAVRIEVGITYTSDGELAEDAQVEAVLRADNVTVGPQMLGRSSGGRYSAEIVVPAPGTWAVSVTSSDPTADATGAVTVNPPVTTAAPTTTTATTTTVATTTTEAPTEDLGTEGDDSSLPLVIALVAGGLVLLAGVAVVVLRSSSDDETDGEDQPGAEGPTGPGGPGAVPPPQA
jgi:hypothetical protein